jgi:hypothetical protein
MASPPNAESNFAIIQWLIGGGLVALIAAWNDRRKTLFQHKNELAEIALKEKADALADIKSRVDSIEVARREAREEYMAEKAMFEMRIGELNNKLDHAQHEAFKREIAHKEEIQTWMIKLMDQERNHQAEKQEWVRIVTELKLENKEMQVKLERLEAHNIARSS